MARAVQFEPPVRAGTDARIFAAAPIDEIMPAFLARRRVTGNLVSREPGALAQLLGRLIEDPARLLVRAEELAALLQRREGRAGLYGQLIQREMRGRHLQGARQFLAPRLRRLAGAGIDEVERNALEIVFCNTKRAERLICVMGPPQRLEAGIVKRLDAEGNPVHAARPEAREAVRLDAGRVRLQSNFNVPAKGPVAGDALQYRGGGFGPHARGRAAAEEDAEHLARAGQLPHMVQLRQIGGEKPGLVDAAMTDMGIEIAIGAFGLAEGPMDINREAGAGLCFPLRILLPPPLRGRVGEGGWRRNIFGHTPLPSPPPQGGRELVVLALPRKWRELVVLALPRKWRELVALALPRKGRR
ncbi:hypothetical protein BMS3Bbin10_01851 [bacterium BMS3Bbin10]|nr:hypothetical protein BMS3Bbin10_01851 [bacterium BMS3Bbin10]